MAQVKPKVETFAKIKVIGVGGGGGNAISHMVKSKVRGVDFVAVNTDAQALHNSAAAEKIHIGKNLTRGLGSGMNPEIGRQAAEENKDEILESVKGLDMAFISCGMGGGTGTGAAPIIAGAARDAGALTIGVVTRPFSFEGNKRQEIAESGIEELRDRVDALIVVPNDKLLTLVDKKTSLLSAFEIVDDVLRQGVQGISDLITLPGVVNVDFADAKTILKEAGSALMGVGQASGENRAVDAAKQAINNPMLEMSIDGARGILFNVTSDQDIGMQEINEAAEIINENIDPEAKVIFGAVINDQAVRKGEVKITVIATGFTDQTNIGIASGEMGESGAVINDVVKRKTVRSQKNSVQGAAGQLQEEPVKKEEASKTKGAPKVNREIKKRIKVDKKEEQPIPDEEDLEIPAFIRRKMK